jgi:hypothetical protein
MSYQRSRFLPRWYYLVWFGIAGVTAVEAWWLRSWLSAYPIYGVLLFGGIGVYQMVCAHQYYKRHGEGILTAYNRKVKRWLG